MGGALIGTREEVLSTLSIRARMEELEGGDVFEAGPASRAKIDGWDEGRC
jgi:hypothetical protein